MATEFARSGNYKIEPLKGAENYNVWKVQMEDILTDLDLWKYVTGESTRPRINAEEWAKRDRQALTAIHLRVSRNMISHIMSATSSKAA